MKIQCEACGKAEGGILCCADEAVICRGCDQKIHTANKLSQRHHRLSLLNQPHQLPPCDVCPEKKGYIFCLEDRKLVCKDCDEDIHRNSPYGLAHQRFLIAGLKLALDPSDPIPTVAPSSSSTTVITSPPIPQPISDHHDHRHHHHDQLVQYYWPPELDFQFSDMDDSSNISNSSHY